MTALKKAQARERERYMWGVGEAHPQHIPIFRIIITIPFFLEPLLVPLDQGWKKYTSNENLLIIIKTAHHLTPLGVNVLKVEFPQM